jgi:peptide/nickel transport system permease protein
MFRLLSQLGLRIALAGGTVLFVSVFVFVAMRLGPVDPAVLLGGDQATEADMAAIRRSLGLGASWPNQYLRWATLVFSGDFGRSLYTGRPVVEAILARAEPTAVIALATLVLASLLGGALGLSAALRHGSWIDRAVMAGSVLGFSVPVFVLGYLLILMFSMQLGWFPVQGYTPLAIDPSRAVKSVALPVITLTPVYLSIIARITRASALEIVHADYVRTALAKGLPPRIVTLRYVLLNALLPIITAIGAGFAMLIGGAVVTETVFSIPGIGRLLVDAVLRRDYPIIQGVVLVLSTIFILVNLVVDLLYAAIDPRVRL